MIVRVSVVLRRTVVGSGDWRFDNLSGSQIVKNFRPLLLALLLACEVICGLFFFQNVKNFRPHQRERQLYCANGWLFERKPIKTESKKGNSKVHVPINCAKTMRHFVYLCKNIYIYDICIFQFLSRAYKPLATLLWILQNQVKELWQ